MRKFRVGQVKILAGAAAVAMIATACGGGAVSSGDKSTASSGSGASATDYLTKTCAGSYKPTQGITDDTIKVGFSGALGGPYATVGVGIWGMLGYFDMVNAAGGVKGADGKMRKISVTYKDDQYVPATAKANAQSLADSDGVFALLGIVGSSANQAIRPLTNSECLPDMFATAGAPELGDPAYPWEINGLISVYSGEGETYAAYLKKNKPTATVAIIAQDDDYGRAEVGSFQDAIAGSGIKIVKAVTFETTDTDLSSQITTLAASKADVVITIALGAAQLQSINQIGNHPDWQPLVIAAPIAVSQLKLLNAAAGKNLITSNAPNLDDSAVQNTPVGQLYQKWVKPEFDKNKVTLPLSTGSGGWNAAALFVQSIQNAKGMTRADVMNAAHNLKPDTTNMIVTPGLTYETTPTDPYLQEGFAIGKWDPTTKTETTVQTVDLNGQVKFKDYSKTNMTKTS